MTEKKMIGSNPYGDSYLELEGKITEFFEVDGYEFYIIKEEDKNKIQNINDDMIKEYCEEHNLDCNNINKNEILEKIGNDKLSQAYSDSEAVKGYLHWNRSVPEEILKEIEKETKWIVFYE